MSPTTPASGPRVLILGGTGLISVGIIKHLLARAGGAADVTCFNRGKSDAKDDGPLPAAVKQLHGDRDTPGALERAVGDARFDAVIDMICFSPEQARATADLCRGRTPHLLFCSTVCTYGVDVPPNVVVDETFPQNPISGYGRNKVACEQLLTDAGRRDGYAVTIVRPSCTYGEGAPLIDNLEGNGSAWGRVRRDLPVLCAGDGRGLWNATHRDDVGKLFAGAVGNDRTHGRAYNATTQRVFTWNDFYREAAAHFGKRPRVLYMPAEWIAAHDPKRFGLLKEITQYHGAYTSARAMADVPEFRCEIGFEEGASRTLSNLERRGALNGTGDDPVYDQMIEKATAAGVEAVEL